MEPQPIGTPKKPEPDPKPSPHHHPSTIGWGDPRHPIWRFLNLIILVVVMYIFSRENAQNFDETEVKMITEIMIVMFGVEAIKYTYQKMKEKEGDE